MKVKVILLLLSTSFCFSQLKAQNVYSCFQNDIDKKLKISVCFDKDDKALYVKYNGNDETIPLFYSKTEIFPNNPGGHPRAYIHKTYIEKYREKITGKFIFSNTGIGGRDVTFYRKKDNKKFYFSLIPCTDKN